MKKLTLQDVELTVHAQPEDIPIAGNALASGDDDADRECEEQIRADLASGNEWAWCVAVVEIVWTAPNGEIFRARETLGVCSYASEKDFRTCDYFHDMVNDALARLNRDTLGIRLPMQKLTDDRSRAEWLQCLQAAAALLTASTPDHYSLAREVCDLADLLFAQLRERCET